jgi:hypothetical protein
VIIPLSIYLDRSDKTTGPQSDVQAAAGHWAAEAGWSVAGVPPRASSSGRGRLAWPRSEHCPARRDLDAAGRTGPDVRVHLTVAGYHPA